MSQSTGERPVSFSASVTDTLAFQELTTSYINHIINDGPHDVELTFNNEAINLFVGEFIEDVRVDLFKLSYRTLSGGNTATLRALLKEGNTSGRTPRTFAGTATTTEASVEIKSSYIFFLANDGDDPIQFGIDRSVDGNAEIITLNGGDVLEDLAIPIHRLYYKATTGSNAFRFFGVKRAI